jgi:hypothetical protein
MNNSDSTTNDEFDVLEDTSLNDTPKKEDFQEEGTNKDRFNYVISYIPPLFFLLLFTDVERSEKLDKHLKQSLVLFTLFLSLVIFFSIIWVWFLGRLITLAYVWAFAYLAYSAYYFKYIEIPAEKEMMWFFDKYLFNKMKK